MPEGSWKFFGLRCLKLYPEGNGELLKGSKKGNLSVLRSRKMSRITLEIRVG